MTSSLFSFPPALPGISGLAPRSIHAASEEEGGCMKMYAQLLTGITSSFTERYASRRTSTARHSLRQAREPASSPQVGAAEYLPRVALRTRSGMTFAELGL